MSVPINKIVEVEIDFTPEELGEVFASLDSEQMANFFNAIAAEVATWERSFRFQMQYVTDASNLSKAAREIMHTIGEYADKSIPTPKAGEEDSNA